MYDKSRRNNLGRCTVYSRHLVEQHSVGHWLEPAGEAARCLSAWIKDSSKDSSDDPHPMPIGAFWELEEFFSEVELALGCKHEAVYGSYRLAMRALGFCFDQPVVFIDDETFTTLEGAEAELRVLAGRFRAIFASEAPTEEEQWLEAIRLAEFLGVLSAIERKDSLLDPSSRAHRRRYPRIH